MQVNASVETEPSENGRSADDSFTMFGISPTVSFSLARTAEERELYTLCEIISSMSDGTCSQSAGVDIDEVDTCPPGGSRQRLKLSRSLPSILSFPETSCLASLSVRRVFRSNDCVNEDRQLSFQTNGCRPRASLVSNNDGSDIVASKLPSRTTPLTCHGPDVVDWRRRGSASSTSNQLNPSDCSSLPVENNRTRIL